MCSGLFETMYYRQIKKYQYLKLLKETTLLATYVMKTVHDIKNLITILISNN